MSANHDNRIVFARSLEEAQRQLPSCSNKFIYYHKFLLTYLQLMYPIMSQVAHKPQTTNRKCFAGFARSIVFVVHPQNGVAARDCDGMLVEYTH